MVRSSPPRAVVPHLAALLLLLLLGGTTAATVLVRQQDSDACSSFLDSAQSCLRSCLGQLIASGSCTDLQNNCCAVTGSSKTSATVCVNQCCSTASLTVTSSPITFGSNSSFCAAPNSGSSGSNGSSATGNGSSTNSTTQSSTCFSSHALVELESGAHKRMDELNIGDRVKVAHGLFSNVFMFTHKDPQVENTLVSIATESDHAITLTPGHYLYLNDVLAPASSAKIGDTVVLGTGSTSKISGISETVETGLYNPQTLHGDIVVDGVVASTYTTAVSPTFGHAWLAPVRAVYRMLGVSGGVFSKGADSFAGAMPNGPAVC